MITTSHKKTVAYKHWKAGMDFPQIASRIGVAEATAEVYVIDCFCEGHENLSDSKKLLQDLEVDEGKFRSIATEACKDGITLRQIRDKTALRYNEIRAVVAYMIHHQ